MSDEELCKDARLAAKCLKDTDTFPTGQGIFLDCADRIEALTAEREWFEEEWVSAVDKLNKAVELAKEAIETMASGPFFPDEEERRLLSKLAEIENSEAVTLGEKG
jgi:hypothetical protein